VILAAMIAAGISVGRHFGVLDGIAAALVIYALAPYVPKGTP